MMPKTSQAAGLHRASLEKLHDLDAALELMYYGWRGMTLEADEYLAKQGLSRPHHRILYVVARRPDIAIGSGSRVLRHGWPSWRQSPTTTDDVSSQYS
jgi:hypothetical protein